MLTNEQRRQLATFFDEGNHGWKQGNYTDFKGNYCALGAIYSVCAPNVASIIETGEDFGSEELATQEALGAVEVALELDTSLWAWNDRAGRTIDDVRAAFRRAFGPLDSAAGEGR